MRLDSLVAWFYLIIANYTPSLGTSVLNGGAQRIDCTSTPLAHMFVIIQSSGQFKQETSAKKRKWQTIL